MTYTTNKGYNNQVTGTNNGTWGTVLNSNFTTIDNNLGGTLSLSVAGSANVVLSAAQAQNLIYNFTGALTGNITISFPQQGGFYFINNQTTGAFTITVLATGCTGSIIIPQGSQVATYVDATGLVLGVIGTNYTFQGGTVTGTANALIVAQSYPTNFSLNVGTFITFTPILTNTASATLTAPDGSTHTIQKAIPTGLANLAAGDLGARPIVAQWNGSVWIALTIVYYPGPVTKSTNFNLSIAYLFQPIICTAALTITVPQVSTNFVYYFWCEVNASGGAVIITPYSTDIINANGLALAAGASYTIPQFSQAKIYTDASGNIYIDNPTVPSVLPNGTTASLQSNGDNSLKISTTSYVYNAIAASLSIKTIHNQYFTTSGTYIPTANMSYCIVEAVGGGGGGGGASNSQSVASGGGGGGYCRKIITASAVGASQTVTIGTGGTSGSSAGGNGGAGNNTTFGAILTANGGLGGIGDTNAGIHSGGTPVAGGTATGGDINISGGYSQGSAVWNGGIYVGQPGNSFLSTLTTNNTGSLQGTGFNGNTGNLYGGGGGAASGGNATGTKSGGIGGAGICIITEYCTQ